ncbi:carbohydrate ABC transporter permease [Candidatus Borkfalkia ceftriaxoniphila]|uniref:Carbohydrate ABC transporter permease n=2 Tax=Candidatus Borkfalkia ceftriaxoniphila TaxID=2508949 RepID=A0A4V1QVF5_9FIRM|nr:carbohydrate ABC transporter permease [Candidatus Borkfalkia ceftriaxoniphila]
MNKLSKAVSKADRIYYIVIDTFLILMLLAILYPLYFIVIASISDTDAIFNGEVFLYPIGFNLKGYAALFENRMIWTGYLNTIWYTLLGTAINIAVTIPAGWAISRKELPWRKFITTYFIITMFFGGGLIPFYLLVSDLGLLDNPLSVILPYGVSVWNMFMVNAFYSSSVPDEILEAAEVDGSGTIRTFFSIVIPLSKPIIAVMVLFYAVAHWNNYFSALIFLSEQKYFPLQLVLREILIMTESAGGSAGDAGTILEQAKLANSIKYSSIIVSTLPILVLYPFVSKFFEKGVMIGALK